jgi:hypothetical protein
VCSAQLPSSPLSINMGAVAAKASCGRSVLDSEPAGSLMRLAGTEVHLVMHGLDAVSRLRLARCCRRLLQDAQHHFAWLPGKNGADVCIDRPGVGGTLELELTKDGILHMCRPRWEDFEEEQVQPNLAALASSSLLRHVPVRLHLLNFKGEPHLPLISRLQHPLYALNCVVMSSVEGTLSLLRSPQLAQLRWLSLPASLPNREHIHVAKLIALELPLLHTLCLLPLHLGGGAKIHWFQPALQCFLTEECLPQLTALQCESNDWQCCLGTASFAGRLKRLTLGDGDRRTHFPSQPGSQCIMSRMPEVQPPPSFDACFAGLLNLCSLTLDAVPGIDVVLASLHLPPSLRRVRVVVPLEWFDAPVALSAVPTLSVLRDALERCPHIELLELSIAGDSAFYAWDPSSRRMVQLRDGCSDEELSRTRITTFFHSGIILRHRDRC